jgi:hypothetical protein
MEHIEMCPCTPPVLEMNLSVDTYEMCQVQWCGVPEGLNNARKHNVIGLLLTIRPQ